MEILLLMLAYGCLGPEPQNSVCVSSILYGFFDDEFSTVPYMRNLK